MDNVEFEKISLPNIRDLLERKIRTYEYKMANCNTNSTKAKYRGELAVARSILFYIDIRYNAKGKV